LSPPDGDHPLRDNCVVARIQFEHRPEQLGASNLADAHLIAASPELYAALEAVVTHHGTDWPWGEQVSAALRKARGEHND
jgi:hypothetical protein